MNYIEYGKENADVIVLLHGGGLSWWNYREAAKKLASGYRVIVPVLDGHGGSDRDFVSIEENAAEIIGFIDENFGGRILMMGGLSLGGQILLEMLSRRSGICRFAVVESACVVPSQWLHAMIGPVFSSCYGLVRKKWFSHMQFDYLRIQKALFEDYHRDTCAVTRENMIAFLKANVEYALKPGFGACGAEVHVVCGERENPRMKKSARSICKSLPGSTLHMMPKLRHGEFSLNHADAYARMITEIIGDCRA